MRTRPRHPDADGIFVCSHVPCRLGGTETDDRDQDEGFSLILGQGPKCAHDIEMAHTRAGRSTIDPRQPAVAGASQADTSPAVHSEVVEHSTEPSLLIVEGRDPRPVAPGSQEGLLDEVLCLL